MFPYVIQQQNNEGKIRRLLANILIFPFFTPPLQSIFCLAWIKDPNTYSCSIFTTKILLIWSLFKHNLMILCKYSGEHKISLCNYLRLFTCHILNTSIIKGSGFEGYAERRVERGAPPIIQSNSKKSNIDYATSSREAGWGGMQKKRVWKNQT